MFSPADIISQLYQYLPRVTNLFSNIVTPASAEIQAGTPQTLALNIPGHGLITGKQVTIINSLINNPIIGVTQYTAKDGVTSILRFQTQAAHDITVGYTDAIYLDGFTDTNLNVEWTELNVPDRYHFDIAYNTLPTLTGNEVMQQVIEMGLNGIWSVTVVDADNITISLTGNAMFMQPGSVPQIEVVLSQRITWVKDFKTVQEMYTKEAPDNNWLFLVMEDSRLSKDAYIPDDATAKNTPQTEQRLYMINNFTIDVIIPTGQDIGGANAVQLCWGPLLPAIIKVMSGVQFNTADANAQYVTSLKGHSALTYNRAYYGHGYTFEYVYVIDNDAVFSGNFIDSINLEGFNISLIPPVDAGSTFNLDTEASE